MLRSCLLNSAVIVEAVAYKASWNCTHIVDTLVLLPATWQPQTTEDPQKVHNYRDDSTLRKRRNKQAVHKCLQVKQCYQTSLSDYLDVASHRRWCMPEDVLCDTCKEAHQDTISPIEKFEQVNVHTGLQLIQQERLRAHTELVQYRLNLASVKGTCLPCKATRQDWNHDFSTCQRRIEVFEERNKSQAAARRTEAEMAIGIHELPLVCESAIDPSISRIRKQKE